MLYNNLVLIVDNANMYHVNRFVIFDHDCVAFIKITKYMELNPPLLTLMFSNTFIPSRSIYGDDPFNVHEGPFGSHRDNEHVSFWVCPNCTTVYHRETVKIYKGFKMFQVEQCNFSSSIFRVDWVSNSRVRAFKLLEGFYMDMARP